MKIAPRLLAVLFLIAGSAQSQDGLSFTFDPLVIPPPFTPGPKPDAPQSRQDRPTFSFVPTPLDVPLPFGPGPMPGPPQQNRNQQNGPWTRYVVVYRADSRGQVSEMHTFERAGVPTVARLKVSRIAAAFQHFPKDDQRNFDRVAISFSSDEGKTWTKPTPIAVEDMEQGLARPFDPTLVPLPDGRVRMYFTSNRSPRFEESTPAIYSAISDDGIHYTFEPGVRFAIEGRVVIDCAVCLHNGTFHMIVPDNGTPEDMRRERESLQPPRGSGAGYHAVSKDGLTFERVADLKTHGNAKWLGNLTSDGAQMTFIGTGHAAPQTQAPGSRRPSGGWMGTSTDGTTWNPVQNIHVPGAVPGAVQDGQGLWIIITTSETRR
jgi:hypothetical protein